MCLECGMCVYMCMVCVYGMYMCGVYIYGMCMCGELSELRSLASCRLLGAGVSSGKHLHRQHIPYSGPLGMYNGKGV